jgi:uncharacterized protein (TIGR02246 family)
MPYFYLERTLLKGKEMSKEGHRMTSDYGDQSVSNDLERTTPMHDETKANHSAEEVALRALYQQLMDGWNQGSGDAFAAVFTADGDLVGFDGTHLKGQEEITRFHQELFDKWLEGSRLVGEVKDVRFLSPDVALMHAVGGTVMRGKSEPSPERDSIQTLVARRQEGNQWRLAAFQNTRLHPIGRGAGVFVVWTLSDLLWKVYRLISRRTRRRRRSS